MVRDIDSPDFVGDYAKPTTISQYNIQTIKFILQDHPVLQGTDDRELHLIRNAATHSNSD